MIYRKRLIINLAMSCIIVIVAFVMGSQAFVEMYAEKVYRGYQLGKMMIMLGFFLYGVLELGNDIENIQKYWWKNE
jgi:hypothetical protein